MPQHRDPDDLYRALLPAGREGVVSASHKEKPVPRIAEIDPDSPAARAGLKRKEAIVTADDVVLRDIIDWRWVADGARVVLVVHDVQDHERIAVLEREAGETWGIEFEHVVFDGVKTCRNSCAFCFVTQLPKGLRRPLYVRDDDYRLSFLQGNFITLTNLADEDIERIDEQRLSPLYISLHSADPDVRKQLVCAHDDDALRRFDQLVEVGIDLHVQIVLVPGENDGARLDQTLGWLAQREGVRSVGVVPVGYTKYQSRFSRSYENWRDAAAVIDQLERWREASRRRDGISWVHAADELFLNARRPVPPAGAYDGFPQYDNGIGLVRVFTDEVTSQTDQLADAVSQWRDVGRTLSAEQRVISIITGELFAPVIESLIGDTGYEDTLRVLPVPNHFFGGNVSVTGLLTESDLSAAVHADGGVGVYLLPDIVANADGLTLDDVPSTDLGPLTAADLRLVSSDAHGLVQGIRNAAECPPVSRTKTR